MFNILIENLDHSKSIDFHSESMTSYPNEKELILMEGFQVIVLDVHTKFSELLQQWFTVVQLLNIAK